MQMINAFWPSCLILNYSGIIFNSASTKYYSLCTDDPILPTRRQVAKNVSIPLLLKSISLKNLLIKVQYVKYFKLI
ncbi:hypothetical protein HZS_376 [Henneguya salminicola]|nr:hypothetical protein HZS_376 [Henneguya salminicola]